jgi:hypothetical protein
MLRRDTFPRDNEGMGSMATENPKLQAQIEAAVEIARSENRQPEDVLKDALEQYERSKKLRQLGAYGREQARRTGLRPSDIEREIAAERQTRRR